MNRIRQNVIAIYWWENRRLRWEKRWWAKRRWEKRRWEKRRWGKRRHSGRRRRTGAAVEQWGLGKQWGLIERWRGSSTATCWTTWCASCCTQTSCVAWTHCGWRVVNRAHLHWAAVRQWGCETASWVLQRTVWQCHEGGHRGAVQPVRDAGQPEQAAGFGRRHAGEVRRHPVPHECDEDVPGQNVLEPGHALPKDRRCDAPRSLGDGEATAPHQRQRHPPRQLHRPPLQDPSVPRRRHYQGTECHARREDVDRWTGDPFQRQVEASAIQPEEAEEMGIQGVRPLGYQRTHPQLWGLHREDRPLPRTARPEAICEHCTAATCEHPQNDLAQGVFRQLVYWCGLAGGPMETGNRLCRHCARQSSAWLQASWRQGSEEEGPWCNGLANRHDWRYRPACCQMVRQPGSHPAQPVCRYRSDH